jgi:hypothetical protein
VNSREDCLHEASECDRLAQLANTQATRTLLAVAAFQWRKLAEKAAERQKNPLAVGVGNDRSELARESHVLAQRGVRPLPAVTVGTKQVPRLLAN